MSLQVISNIFPQLIDSRGTIYLNSSIICENCQEGKYSLNKQDTECQECPNSTVNALKQQFFQRMDIGEKMKIQILFPIVILISCLLNRISRQYREQGYKGPLCYPCDVFGEIWGRKYSEMYSPGKCKSCSENLTNIFIQNILFFLLMFLYNLLFQKI
ncbi:hypothetical protein ABPG72_002425 [Tetrahymena utriculariae]